MKKPKVRKVSKGLVIGGVLGAAALAAASSKKKAPVSSSAQSSTVLEPPWGWEAWGSPPPEYQGAVQETALALYDWAVAAGLDPMAITITDGWRGPGDTAGGKASSTSVHPIGYAADFGIYGYGLTPAQIFWALHDEARASGRMFDQIIFYEKGPDANGKEVVDNHIHFGHRYSDGSQRKQYLVKLADTSGPFGSYATLDEYLGSGAAIA